MGRDKASNEPAASAHWSASNECLIVLHEQGEKHREASRAAGRAGKGYAEGGGGWATWQSHHIVCLSAVTDRPAKDTKTKPLLEDSLYITPWNINEADNMIGLPQKHRYKKAYDTDIPKTLKGAARAAAVAKAQPQNLPAHNIDHNTDDGYTDDVVKHLKNEVWNKFDSKAKDHLKDAEWLQKRLNAAVTKFYDILIERGGRKGVSGRGAKGTAAAWLNRMNKANKDSWINPFSMANKPTKRSPGIAEDDLEDIFEEI